MRLTAEGQPLTELLKSPVFVRRWGEWYRAGLLWFQVTGKKIKKRYDISVSPWPYLGQLSSPEQWTVGLTKRGQDARPCLDE